MTRTKIPRHIAIIMDGNGRWATMRGLPRIAGHKQGVVSVRKTIEKAASIGIEVLSLYCFSTENWSRPSEEVQFLMNTFLETLYEERPRMLANNIRFMMIGDRTSLSPDLVKTTENLENETKGNTGLKLVLAINYGGRSELLRAIKGIASDGVPPDKITEETVRERLYTVELPDPDLIIRTSGEMRLSNYMIWQSAYSELLFMKKLWPDFRERDLMSAIAVYSRRQRRFGGLGGK
ncbi:MAG TPA: isoprenyl transferase [Caldisericia bacterium]|nr:isoprenyl transferase [Caldisericia bacterium]HOU07620.1 isoprenyl transferase [Caldisericia bacterium]HPL88919.1 isoprenyl transferase [Caldisericia bacterium]HQG59056.1 isoprenyl transferase [Caldisericia bacterium]HQH49395.1 isoprenyl transferase [Caldisericia bacterium]